MINLVTKERLAGITFTEVFRFADMAFFLSYAPDNQAGVEQQSTVKVREHYESPSHDKEVILFWSPAPLAVDAGQLFARARERGACTFPLLAQGLRIILSL